VIHCNIFSPVFITFVEIQFPKNPDFKIVSNNIQNQNK